MFNICFPTNKTVIMKKMILLVASMCILFIFPSCVKRAKNIRVKDLSSACDCVNANIIITREMMQVASGANMYRDLNTRQKDAIDKLVDIYEWVNTYCGMNYSWREMRDCKHIETFSFQEERVMNLIRKR